MDALNFSWITEALAVGGRFPEAAVGALAATHAMTAVVDLRVEACDDVALLSRHGLAFLHLPTEDLCGVSRSMIDEGVAFVRPRLARGERVLIHCEHGIGRSAVLALSVLVDAGMTPLEALRLAKARRRVVSPSPAQYEAWVEWMEAHRAANAPAWDIPDFHSFGCIAYSHLDARAG
jgi:protein-tyrosine phosphatase